MPSLTDPEQSDGLLQQDAACDGEVWHGLELRLLAAIEGLLNQSFDMHFRDLRDMLKHAGAYTHVQEHRKMELDQFLIENEEDAELPAFRLSTNSAASSQPTAVTGDDTRNARLSTQSSAYTRTSRLSTQSQASEMRDVPMPVPEPAPDIQTRTNRGDHPVELQDAARIQQMLEVQLPEDAANENTELRQDRPKVQHVRSANMQSTYTIQTPEGTMKLPKDFFDRYDSASTYMPEEEGPAVDRSSTLPKSNSHFHIDEHESKGVFQVLDYIKVHRAFQDGADHGGSCLDKAANCVQELEHKWKTIREPPRSGRVFRLVHSQCFESICQLAIVLNAGLLAYAADWQVQHIDEKKEILDVCETLFLAFFLVELICRLMAHRLYFFVNKNMYWNIFDFFLVFFSSLHWLMIQSLEDGSGSNLYFMRLLRLLKLARVLRSLRLFRFVSSLTQLLDAFVYSMHPLFWGCIMFAFVIYIFSLVFIEGVIGYIQAEASIDPEVRGAMVAKFGSLGRAILSLYKAVAGGEDWDTSYDLLQLAGPVYGFLFVFFIMISSFAIANLMTALVVEQGMAAAEPTKFEQILHQRRKFAEQKNEFLAICRKMDKDGTGKISWPAFKDWIQRPLMIAYMASVDLDIYDAKVFFTSVANKQGDYKSLDNTEVTIERFVEGCMHMKGGATAIDMQRQLFEIDTLQQDLKTFQQQFSERMRLLERMVSRGFKFLVSSTQLLPEQGTSADFYAASARARQSTRL